MSGVVAEQVAWAPPAVVLQNARRLFGVYARQEQDPALTVRSTPDTVTLSTDPEKMTWDENTLGVGALRVEVTARPGVAGTAVTVSITPEWLANPHDRTVGLTGVPGGLGGLAALAAPSDEQLNEMLAIVSGDLAAMLERPQASRSGVSTPGE